MGRRSTSSSDVLTRVTTRVRNEAAAWAAPLRWHLRTPGRRHALPAPLVVTLTSYPPRFGSLLFALRSLLAQTMRPDHVVLWVSPSARAAIPAEVERLEGLEIRTTADLGPYTKIVPALRAFPEAYLATADDDTFYRPDWLADLVAGWQRGEGDILCHRAHRVAFGPDLRPTAYAGWEAEVDGPVAGTDLFPTGVGGVLYPPGILPPLATDMDLFRRLAPRTDDVWLFVMGRMAGARVAKVGPYRPLLTCRGAQDQALRVGNVLGGENDGSLQRLVTHFGWPPQPDHAGLPEEPVFSVAAP